MSLFTNPNAQRLAFSAFGAMALTVTCVTAAVAPAGAATVPGSIAAWQDKVEDQIAGRRDSFSLKMDAGKRAEAVLAVRFTPQGDYAGAEIARSSGNRKVNRHALQVAGSIKYPPLPESALGRPQTVAMRLYFGRADSFRQLDEMQSDLKSVRLADAGGIGGTQVTAK
ncbi:TonB family protein [Sphingomonas sp. AP4-R1]|uniref:energy transducer TonB family protein n=1 Tax=Sphingomonas sp. AP4-R1 TaxID=2735134 RepID=UPI001493D6BA|nr:energy transducer TonB [Sphingomonas sp. AP4-R1]QJU57290.1 TonB family protein [Sphingomonas sp. AP4-R1]